MNEPLFRPRHRPLVWAIGLSLLLHLCVGMWWWPRAGSGASAPPPFSVHLLPPLPNAQALLKPFGAQASARTKPVPGPASAATSVPTPATASDTAQPPRTVDAQAAFAAARAIALEARSERRPGATTPPVSVETAVARATRPDVVVESRGANGEWVTQDRHVRCVARIQRKWFEEGVPMLPLCEIKKG